MADPDSPKAAGAEYRHPSGQVPAYEWYFSDVNPPVHAWACLSLHQMEKMERGRGADTWNSGLHRPDEEKLSKWSRK